MANRLLLRAAARAGLVSGVTIIYMAMVGMIEKFEATELVGQQITLARLFLAIPPILAAWVAVRPRIAAGRLVETTAGQAGLGGAIAGVASGVAVGAGIVFVNAFGIERIRAVFIAVSPRLLEILTFNRGIAAGVVIAIAGGSVLGAAGGVTRSLPPVVRRSLYIGGSVTLLMGLLQRIIPIALRELGFEPRWLYVTGSGLTWLGAAIAFVVSASVSAQWRRKGFRPRERVRELTTAQPSLRVGGLVVALVVLGAVPYVLGTVISDVLGTVAIFLLLGLGLNIVVGYAGLLDLGYVAFFGFGAYAMALLTGASVNTTTGAAAPAFGIDLNFYVALPVLVLLAAGAGVLIGAPVLRLRGDYLAIVTLGLGEMVTILIQSNWLREIVGGPQGMRDITKAGIFGLNFQDDPQHFYYLAVAFVLFAAFVSWRLANSRVGRAWNALREDEQVADAIGVSTTRYKLLAFATGGAIGSLGGALLAVQIGSLTPRSFTILVSIQALAIVILGGMGSLPGVVVGGLVLIGLPGFLREFEEFRPLIYGAVIVAIMVLRPQGLVPNVRRSRELHEEEVAQDEWAKGGKEPEPAAVAVAAEDPEA